MQRAQYTMLVQLKSRFVPRRMDILRVTRMVAGVDKSLDLRQINATLPRAKPADLHNSGRTIPALANGYARHSSFRGTIHSFVR